MRLVRNRRRDLRDEVVKADARALISVAGVCLATGENMAQQEVEVCLVGPYQAPSAVLRATLVRHSSTQAAVATKLRGD